MIHLLRKSIFNRIAGLFLVTVLATLASPGATTLGGMSSGEAPPVQPQSINPDWRNLGITWRVSVASDGTEGNGYSSQDVAISVDGRYVVFASASYNLVPGDAHYGYEDIFLHDNQTGATERISVSSAGVAGNNDSFYGVDISADGRYVVFASKAINLVAGDNNAKSDVFLRDRQESTTLRVSVSSTGTQSDNDSWLPRISDDGSTVVYTSRATNLVSGDLNNKWDIFAYNRISAHTERISVSSAGSEANGESGNNKTPAISADGRYVAFTSYATNLVTVDTNNFCDVNEDGTFNENCPDVFVRDRTNGTTERVSVNSYEEEGNNFSMLPAISGDGNLVAFYSAASNLVANDTNTCLSFYYYSNPGPCPDVFVRNRQAGTTERVSVSSSGDQTSVDPMDFSLYPPAISSDGHFVAFTSAATNLAAGATNGYTQILIHDRTTHETTLVSASTYRWQGNSWSHNPPDLSATGRYVAFPSSASDLVTDDANEIRDIFVRDREGYTYGMDGTVRNEAGNPMSGVWVGYGTKVGQHKDTDTNGEYELYYMPTGTYSIRAMAPGYLSDPPYQLVSVPPTTIDVDFVMRLRKDVFLPLVER